MSIVDEWHVGARFTINAVTCAVGQAYATDESLIELGVRSPTWGLEEEGF
jgi:hypothetical protein